MNDQTLVIYDFSVIYKILKEIEDHFNFRLINISKNKLQDCRLKNMDNFLIISPKKIKNEDNLIIIDKLPIEIPKLIESINIKFLKKIYNQQSEIDLGNYKLNLNSRMIFNNENSLNLTEREANIIIFLSKSGKPVKISKLQTEVWGHNSKLETHTVETHIYRLRSKISKSFKDDNFISSTKQGYVLKKINHE